MPPLQKVKLINWLKTLQEQGSHSIVIVSCVAGFFIHLGFCAVFALMELWTLAALNVLSSICWIYFIWLSTHSKVTLAVHLATLEVLSHAVLATVMLGPKFGFHFFLWPASTLIVLNPGMKLGQSALISLITMLVFGSLSTFVNINHAPDYAPWLVDGIFFINIMASGISTILAGFVARSVYGEQSQILQVHARTDELTKLYNRRHVMEFLTNTEANRRRNHIPYCVCLCDLDYFKSVNDLYGHDAGDEVLVKFAKFLKHSTRKTDCVARWGGEEFLIVLTNTPGEKANDTMNTMLKKLSSEHRIAVGDDRQISMSVGIAEARDTLSVNDVVTRADEALYQAKEGGRNRVVLHIPAS